MDTLGIKFKSHVAQLINFEPNLVYSLYFYKLFSCIMVPQELIIASEDRQWLAFYLSTVLFLLNIRTYLFLLHRYSIFNQFMILIDLISHPIIIYFLKSS